MTGDGPPGSQGAGVSPGGRARSVADQTGTDRAPDLPVPLTRTQIELPVATIAKVLVTIALILFVGQVWQILFLLFVGTLIAMVLARPVSWLNGRGLPRGFAIAIVLGAAIAGVALVLWIVTPALVAQVREFWASLPQNLETALAWVATRWPDVYAQAVAWAEAQQAAFDPGAVDVQGVLSQGVDIIAGIVNVVIALIIAVYILADEGRSLDGVYARMPPRQARKLQRTFPAVARVVNGYVTGQAINSTLFAVFTFVLLTLLDVPSAAVLALIAAVGDAIPQVGVTLATIPAVLLALTVSVETAGIVLVAYTIYQAVENYVTSPRVFSQTLQLRPLVTLLAILIGGRLLGIVGVLLALPVAAAIPTVTAIWLDEEEAA